MSESRSRRPTPEASDGLPSGTDERLERVEDRAATEEHYRLVADYTYDWESWFGPDGALRWMSPSCERTTGHPPASFLANPDLLLEIAHPDDRPELAAHLREGFRDPDAKRLRFRIIRVDGAVRWMEHICQPVYRPSGEFAGRRGSTRDITETIETEEALRRREQEFATLADNSPDIVARFDPSFRHLYVNAAVERVTGRPRADFLGRTNEELGMPPALCERWSATLREVFESGEPRALEFSFPTSDGDGSFSLRAVPERGADDSVETVLCTTRDETERRQAESRARSLAKVVESSGDFIGIAALDGRAIYLNRAGQALVGLSGDAAVQATRVEDYLFPDDLPFVREKVLPTVLGTGRWAGEFRFRHFVTGEAIDVHWDVVRIDDAETGEPMRLATVTRDIRDRKAAEASLLEADRRKDEFLAVLGHELRNPMAPIRNAVDVLRLVLTAKDPRVEWAVGVLDRQTAHLGRLLDDLLDVSRIVRGQLELKRGPVELRDVVRNALDGVTPLLVERRHRLETEPPPAGLSVEGDLVRLSQILLNLLLNAAKYTPEGGVIRLTIEAEGGEVRICIRDNGLGISPQRIGEIFNPFSQGPRPEGDPPSGLGLGLTVSRRLAELHGGHLTVRSDWPQPGSEFTLHLPRLAGAKGASTHRPTPEQVGRGVPVLVVDDNPDVAGALAMLLEVLGCQTQVAASGDEALALAEHQCPRLVLLDIGLPGMDGLEVARRLRQRYPNPDRLLLVAVTGYGHAEARDRSRAAGFDLHLAKPVDLPTLESLLAGLGPQGHTG